MNIESRWVPSGTDERDLKWATLRGRPIDVIYQVTVRFNLQ
jgi:hypothetical protein